VEQLRWHEHQQVFALPTGSPQPAEIDWALGPLAAWRQAQLLERLSGREAELCRAYRLVAAGWSEGDSAYRARSLEAARRVSALACGSRR
jgi:hypothetical protein